MDHYQEIALLPDPEFVPTVLMNALFGKLHQALAHLESSSLGVSFPDLDPERPSLGGRLRVHGSRPDLEGLGATGWLGGLRDHAHIGAIRSVPDQISHVVVRRVQAKSSAERMRRRLAKRKGVTMEEARRLIPDGVEKRLNQPFVTLRSASTGQNFHLFIKQEEPRTQPAPGDFSQYGLSPTATVPWF